MNKALRMEDDRLDRAAAEVENEYQVKNKEKEAKKKAAIESIAEHRATVVRNLTCSHPSFWHVLRNTF